MIVYHHGDNTQSLLHSTSAAVDKQQKSLVVATKCRGNDQRLLVMKQCEDLVQELTERSESWPFLKPVTRRDVCTTLITRLH